MSTVTYPSPSFSLARPARPARPFQPCLPLVADDSRPAAVMRSRFTSARCPVCGAPIYRGEAIARLSTPIGRARWAHVQCAVSRTAPAPSTPDAPAPAPAPSTPDAPAPALPDAPAPSTPDAPAPALPDPQLLARIDALEGQVGELTAAVAAAAAPRVIEVRQPDGTTHEVTGTVHEVFDRVLALAIARKNIFLPGPAGCGKSHLAQQVAEALGLRFGSISCSAGMSESQLLGRMVPMGAQGQFEFLTTQFLECYEDGGVFLFDEIDAADANVLLVVNSALANGHLSVPSRHAAPVAHRHADFVCIAAANTWGNGADRQYVGRNQLDESTLDRFRIGCVPMDYNRKLEKALCPMPELFDRMINYRRAIIANRLNRILSTRFMRDAFEMVSQWGWTQAQVDDQLFAGWREDEVAKVVSPDRPDGPNGNGRKH